MVTNVVSGSPARPEEFPCAYNCLTRCHLCWKRISFMAWEMDWYRSLSEHSKDQTRIWKPTSQHVRNSENTLRWWRRRYRYWPAQRMRHTRRWIEEHCWQDSDYDEVCSCLHLLHFLRLRSSSAQMKSFFDPCIKRTLELVDGQVAAVMGKTGVVPKVILSSKTLIASTKPALDGNCCWRFRQECVSFSQDIRIL